MHIARALRFASYPVVLAVGEPLWTHPFSNDHHLVGSAGFPAWATAYVVFVVAFHLSASIPEGARVRRLCMLGVMTCATLTMTALLTCDFGALSLVVLASQAALVLPRRHTAVFVAAQTAVLWYVVVKRADWSEFALSHVVGLAAAEIFAAVAVHLARRAAETARDLARANDELTRAHERTRISRELHDVLGHDLAALGLQLEVATHVPPERAGAHVAKAKELSARLLRNVRDVVRETHESPGADLGRALRALCADVQGMRSTSRSLQTCSSRTRRAATVCCAAYRRSSPTRSSTLTQRIYGSPWATPTARLRSRRATTVMERATCVPAMACPECARGSRRWGAGCALRRSRRARSR